MSELGTFFHVGIVVPDIHEAVERYSRQLGVAFKTPSSATVPNAELHGADGEISRRPVEALYTYSVSGPPHYELLQTQDTGVWSAENEGLHHIGRWVEDVEAEDRRLVADGLVPEMRMYTDAGDLHLTYFAPAERGGLRLEILGVGGRADHEEWLFGTAADAWT